MKRQYSNRPKLLSPEQERAIDDWYKSPRTMTELAETLGVCAKTVSNYVHKRHKPRNPYLSSVPKVVPHGTNEVLNEQ